MENSTFRYKLCNPTGRQKPFSKCSYGIYYKAARKLKEEHEQNEQEEKERGESKQEENEQEHFECVIMDYGKDSCHVMSQIKLSSQIGNEYALEVIHIDNTKTSEVKVIYPYFENTMSKWLKKLDLPKKTDEYDKWMQDEVFPKIRKLWQILLKMKDNGININKSYCLPLINGVPKLLCIHEEDDEKNKRDMSDGGSSLSNQEQREQELPSSNQGQNNDKDKDKNYLDLHYPIKVLDVVATKLLRSNGSYELPTYIKEAQNFWTLNQNESGLLQRYPLLSIHPVLYNSDEKSRFLQLFYDITFEYGLSNWLDKEMRWDEFRSRMIRAKNDVYEATLHYKSGKSQGQTQWSNRLSSHACNQARSYQEPHSSYQGFAWPDSKRRCVNHNQSSSHPRDQEQSDQELFSSNQGQRDEEPLSSNQGQSNQKAPYYYQGSDIIRFTRNVLIHFKENDKNPQGRRHLVGDEIVETVDRDLAVCSLYYTYAKKIIADRPQGELTKEGWEKVQKEQWDKLKKELSKQEKDERWEPGRKEVELISQAYQPVPLQLYVKIGSQPGKWMKAKEIFKPRLKTDMSGVWMETNEILKPIKLYTKDKRWVEANEILKPLELSTDVGSMKATEIFKPFKLKLWTNRPGNWMEAKEILEADVNVFPRLKLWTKGAWKEDWKEVVEIKNELNQPLELETQIPEERKKAWKHAEEIKNEANPKQELKVLRQGWVWRKLEQIFEDDTPAKLKTRKRSLEAFEDERPRDFITEDNWKKAKEKLEEFLKSLKM